jgi:glycosyltransferase involved in cell wall biosynthesis
LAKVSPQEPSPLIRILVVADLVDEIKNISGVIAAFQSLPLKEQVILQIVGDGPDRSRLETQAAAAGLLDKKIFFHGKKDNTEVYAFLSACSFLVMNSRLETFSLICAEALSCGKPVVATRCGGPEDYLTGEQGILIEPGHAGQLADALKQMIVQYQSYDKEKLKEFAINHFSPATVGKMYFDLYQRILL